MLLSNVLKLIFHKSYVLHTYEGYHKKDRKEINSFVFVAKPEYCAINNAQDHTLYNKWASGLLN